MAFAVEDFEDLLRLLEEHPEWQARLRARVLGGDFERLPGIVAELAEAQRRTEERITSLANQVESLTAETAQTSEALRRLSDTVDTAVEALTGRMDDMTTEFGYMYEMFFESRAAGIFQDWLIRPRTVKFDEVPELEAAADSGLVSDADLKQVGVLDILLAGRDRATREPAYIAVEVSRTVNPDDVDRATKRAEILRRAGLPARAAVGGRRITHEAQTIADANGVIVAILTAQPA